jgi:basic amino acid/polyamine antiporter, APA family
MPTSPSKAPTPEAKAELVRGLGTLDAVLLSVGGMIGTGIFLTAADLARALPSVGWIYAVWLAGGLLTLAGALSYAEMGAMYPRAGGLYHFLKEAYGPFWGFLYGWTAFTVIMTGGIAAIAVGFGEYLGSFVPFFASEHVLWSLPLGPWTWTVNGAQGAAVLAIVLLTLVNVRGLRAGAGLQNLVTVVKIGALLVFALAGFWVPAQVTAPPAPLELPWGALASAFGVAMVAALWSYDGWYGITFTAGEMRDPARSLPRGLLGGTALVVLLYLVMQAVYFRALPLVEMGAAARVGEAAAQSLFGGVGARLLAAAVVVSSFGCLAATILYASRIYLPMAQDGVFFRSVGRIHPTHRTPHVSLWAQCAWAVTLALSGTFSQLYTYVVFASVLFQMATGSALFALRRKHPELPRPYRAWGYPWVPAAFVLASLFLVGNTLAERPVESLVGLALVALGGLAYLGWRRTA